ncbi:MAG: type III-A CRISPR-associated protein Csm2 [Candidatus Saccharicenans sp.]
MNNQRNFINQGQRKDPSYDVPIDEARIKKILAGDAAEMNKYADQLGRYYTGSKNERDNLSTSQIRNVLDEIHKMKEFSSTKLELLRPKLVYAAGKHNKVVRLRQFVDLMNKTINHVNKDNFEQFKNFVEAIVAYHRFYGGK